MKRKQIGEALNYSGRVITAHLLSPDVLIQKDGQDFGVFLSTEAGRKAAMESIDEEEAKK